MKRREEARRRQSNPSRRSRDMRPGYDIVREADTEWMETADSCLTCGDNTLSVIRSACGLLVAVAEYCPTCKVLRQYAQTREPIPPAPGEVDHLIEY